MAEDTPSLPSPPATVRQLFDALGVVQICLLDLTSFAVATWGKPDEKQQREAVDKLFKSLRSMNDLQQELVESLHVNGAQK